MGHLARGLEETAPGAAALWGGGGALVRAHGRPTGAQFWTLDPFPLDVWEDMAREHAAAVRSIDGGGGLPRGASPSRG